MLGIIVLLCFIGACFIMACQFVSFYKKWKSNNSNMTVAESKLLAKYEAAMERLVSLYREDNEMLKEQVKDLTDENKALVKVMDSELFEDAEDEDEDGDEVVVTMEKPIRSSIGKVAEIGRQNHYEVPQSKLFKKIEAAREVVKHAEFLRQEERMLLIDLLTPESDVEAA